MKGCRSLRNVNLQPFFSLLYFEPVAYSPDCFDILRLGCIELNLLTDLLNMHRYGRNISNRLHIPDLAEQFFLCKYMIRILCKKCEVIVWISQFWQLCF